jgi:hypothetical protein
VSHSRTISERRHPCQPGNSKQTSPCYRTHFIEARTQVTWCIVACLWRGVVWCGVT